MSSLRGEAPKFNNQEGASDRVEQHFVFTAADLSCVYH